jgi:type II secretory pathway component HofQ
VVTLAEPAVQVAPGGQVALRRRQGRCDARNPRRRLPPRPRRRGRVIIELSDTSTGIDIRQQGQNIVVDFIKTALPENLRRRLDVVDFGTPVNTVSAFQQGKNVRMVIEPRPVGAQRPPVGHAVRGRGEAGLGGSVARPSAAAIPAKLSPTSRTSRCARC